MKTTAPYPLERLAEWLRNERATHLDSDNHVEAAEILDLLNDLQVEHRRYQQMYAALRSALQWSVVCTDSRCTEDLRAAEAALLEAREDPHLEEPDRVEQAPTSPLEAPDAELRNWFAGQVLTSGHAHSRDPRYIAERCFAVADAMLAASKEPPK